MHVLVTADVMGGVWTYVRELVTGLVSCGHRVTLVSFGEIPSASQTEWLEELGGVDYRATAFRLEWMHDAESDIAQSSRYLESLVQEARPDLLHLNQYAYGALKVRVPKVVVAHSDVVSWWMAVKRQLPPEDSWTLWYRNAVRRGLEQADAVIAPSQWMLGCIRQYYCSPAHCSVIYNGRSPELFNRHWPKENRVLSVGRLWDAGKQVALLLEEELPLPLTVAGTERHPDKVVDGDTVFRRGERPQVEFLGRQNERQLRRLFARAGVYAATSRYEPFGLAPLEAALSGCAIVANDIPSFREIWGDTAFYFDRDDAIALREVIAVLAADSEMRNTFANLAYSRARERYTAGRMVNEYLSVYDSLIGAGTLAA